MQPPSPQRGGFFGGMFDRDEDQMLPAPSRSQRPPLVWGTLTVEGDELVARVSGWRSIVALRRRLAVPLDAVVRAEHDPAVRLHVPAKLRRSGGRSGLLRVGPYHSVQGWSFWSVGLARNAVVVETKDVRYRFLVVEVAEPARTVAEIRSAAGLDESGAVPPFDGGEVTK